MMIVADESALVLSYWVNGGPPFHPTKAPMAIVRFRKPYFHSFGPQVHRLELVNNDLERFVYAFENSTFECLAEARTSSIEEASWNEQQALMIEALRNA